MNIKFTLVSLLASAMLTLNGQVMITENFNTPSTLPAGWVRLNNSSPLGTTSWFVGNAGVFPALSNPDTSYIAANFNNTLGSAGTISNWLITPTVTVNNGGIFQFATRTNTVGGSSSVSPDRLQVYLSLGTGSSVGNTATSLGTFTTLLVAVNPNLTATGYPTNWTVYTTTLSGITGTVSARFGFRYFVTAAGPAGVNSSYIGIDNVKYDLPCPNPTLSVSSATTGVCSGNTVAISASGANTYTWNSSQNTASIVVSPTTTSVYTITGSSIPNCNSSATIAITVTQTPVLAVLDLTTCAGTAATLVAAGANSYSWSNGPSSSMYVVTPTISSTYTLTGANGDCLSTSIASVTLGNALSINANVSPTLICSGQSASISATGGISYTYAATNFTATSNGSNASVSPVSTTIYTISAKSGSCTGSNTVVVNVNSSPTVTLSTGTQSVFCINSAITLSASGAATYSWSGNALVSPSITVITPSISGTYTFGVVGTATNGCNNAVVITRTVNLCTAIAQISANTNELTVYPNPFTNELNISGLRGSIEIYNSLGQLLIQETVLDYEIVNTTRLAKGIYVMKVFNEDTKHSNSFKLIKN